VSEKKLSIRRELIGKLGKNREGAGGSGVQKPCRPRPGLPLPAVFLTAGRALLRVLEPQAPVREPTEDNRFLWGDSPQGFPRSRLRRDHTRNPRLPGRLLRRRPRRRLPEKPLCAHLTSFLLNPEIYSELGRKEGYSIFKELVP